MNSYINYFFYIMQFLQVPFKKFFKGLPTLVCRQLGFSLCTMKSSPKPYLNGVIFTDGKLNSDSRQQQDLWHPCDIKQNIGDQRPT